MNRAFFPRCISYFCLFALCFSLLLPLSLLLVPRLAVAEGLLGTGEGLLSNSPNIPVFIKSQSLTIDSKKRVFVYNGNVEIRRGDLLITSDLVEGYYNEQSKIEKVVCDGNVVISRGEDLRASADRAEYDLNNATIELTQSPELSHHGSALSADKVTLYVDEDKSKAEGNVRVKVIKKDAVIPGEEKPAIGAEEGSD